VREVDGIYSGLYSMTGGVESLVRPPVFVCLFVCWLVG
jgi:hypothetical protein